MGGNLTLIGAPTLINIRSKIHPFITQRIVTHYCSLTTRGGTMVPMVNIIRAIHHVRKRDDIAINESSCELIRAPRIFSTRLLGTTCRRPCAPRFASSTSIIRTLNMSIFLAPKGQRGVGVAAPFSLGVTATLVNSYSV